MKKSRVEILTMTDPQLDKAVKIQGTPYDRKRRVSEVDLKAAKAMYSKGKTVEYIATKLCLNPLTVRYNVDKEWRAQYNANRSGAHTGKDHITKNNRVAYKRKLVAEGVISAK